MTKDVIMDSRIGKKVRGIEKSQFYRDPTIPSLATWVIQKLKADVVARQAGQGLSPSVNSEAERNQNDHLRKLGPKPGSFGMRGDGRQDDCPVSAKSTVSPRLQDTTRSKGNPLSQSNGGGKQSKSASHLLDLMSMSASLPICSLMDSFLICEFALCCEKTRVVVETQPAAAVTETFSGIL